MSTPALIAIRKPDESIEAIYVHWDGYPSHTGNILLNHYNTYEQVEHLINLGNLSSIEKYPDPPKGQTHTFDNPLDDICVAYCRDRKEPFESLRLPKLSVGATIREMSRCGVCYLYLFENNKWYKTTPNSRRWYEMKFKEKKGE